MNQVTDEDSSAGVPSLTSAEPITSTRTGMVDNTKDTNTAVTHERGNGSTTGVNVPVTGDTLQDCSRYYVGYCADWYDSRIKTPSSRRFNSRMRSGWMMTRQGTHAHGSSDDVSISSRPVLDVERECTSAGRRTHHLRQHLDRPEAVPRYFGQQQPGYGMPTTNLHRLYAANHEAQPAVAPAPHHGGQWQGRVGCFQQQNQQVKYPDARQKKLATIQFNGK
ncbi:Beta N-acetyl-glucosaminidase [Phytophthora palmivora]|uniref:Beta N-acetyl-glucosaminidase n=1 Tax=Phytophthora palmivora TaxID=4796 RepID=A0A2P4YKW5_9STRA|nr:Beta N-acetyl-glucosaminidase [Phytophthora palmivora]